MTVQESTPMDVRIAERPDLHLVGRATRLPLTGERTNEYMEEFVAGVPQEEQRRLATLSDTEPAGLLQVTADPERHEEGGETTFMLAAAVADAKEVPEGLKSIWVAAGAWAVVTSEGHHPQAQQDAWAAFETEWLPRQPWRRRPGPSVLAVLDRNDDFSVATCELWLPVEPLVRPEGAA